MSPNKPSQGSVVFENKTWLPNTENSKITDFICKLACSGQHYPNPFHTNYLNLTLFISRTSFLDRSTNKLDMFIVVYKSEASGFWNICQTNPWLSVFICLLVVYLPSWLKWVGLKTTLVGSHWFLTLLSNKPWQHIVQIACCVESNPTFPVQMWGLQTRPTRATLFI